MDVQKLQLKLRQVIIFKSQILFRYAYVKKKQKIIIAASADPVHLSSFDKFKSCTYYTLKKKNYFNEI